ncbi:hypothetical protein LINPERHAP1_LOCUS35186, partial [Linum perenne]
AKAVPIWSSRHPESFASSGRRLIEIPTLTSICRYIRQIVPSEPSRMKGVTPPSPSPCHLPPPCRRLPPPCRRRLSSQPPPLEDRK